MRLLVIGTGYVGLVAGTCFAEMGHHVCCLDIDHQKIESLRKGISPIYEPGLTEMIKRNTKFKRLSFSSDPKSAIDNQEAIFLAVGTPPKENGEANLQYVESAARNIGQYLNAPCMVINKSTVPVGTAQSVRQWIQEELDKRDLWLPFDMVSNPEFLKEGAAIQDFMKPDRIVIGVENTRAEKSMRKIYGGFSYNSDRFHVMDIPSAEMTKYASNAMLACRISFMNEIAGLCDLVGADIHVVRLGMSGDQRIGKHFLYPGVGYGGSCFPKDISELQATAHQYQYNTPLINAVQDTNIKQKQIISLKLREYFAGREGLKGKTLAIWGLAFKPETDDVREAPALALIRQLVPDEVYIKAFDPVASANALDELQGIPRLQVCESEQEAAQDADAIILMTEWKQFRYIDLKAILSNMNGNAFFDGRNQYDPKEMGKLGFDYLCIGRPIQLAQESAKQESFSMETIL